MWLTENGQVTTLHHDDEPDARFPDVVSAMIRWAKSSGKSVRTTYNSRTIIVAGDSDPRLIKRDYYAMFRGVLVRGDIGPYPAPTLPGLEEYSLDDMARASFWNRIASPAR